MSGTVGHRNADDRSLAVLFAKLLKKLAFGGDPGMSEVRVKALGRPSRAVLRNSRIAPITQTVRSPQPLTAAAPLARWMSRR